jgi:hypothetical protein
LNIWTFQEKLTTGLLSWAMASIATGIAMSRGEDEFRKGVGEQFTGWGIVNAAIAVFGQRSSNKRRQQPGTNTPESLAQEKKKLSRLLWINTGLDVFYMLGGWLAVRTRGQSDDRWRGRGWGIIIQGGFLFIFDLVNALLIHRVVDPEHQS